jgi:hypothetical protein
MQNFPPIGNVAGTGASPHAIYTFTLPANTLSTTGGFRLYCSLAVELAATHTSACMVLGIYGSSSNLTVCQNTVAGAQWNFEGEWEFWNNGALSTNYSLGHIISTNYGTTPPTTSAQVSIPAAGTVSTNADANFICGTLDSVGDTIVTGRMRIERLAP